VDKGMSWARRGAVVLAGAGLVAGLLGSYAASASPDGMATTSSSGSSGNPYDPANGHPYRHGVVPTQSQNAKMKAWAAGHHPSTTTSKTLAYGGGVGGIGVTTGVPQVYLVFWGNQWGTELTGSDTAMDPTFSNDPGQAAPYLERLFKGLGTGGETWSGTMTQYCNGVPTGSTSCPSGYTHVGMPSTGVLAGVWYDHGAAQPVPSSSTQLAQEAVNAAAHFSATAAINPDLVQFDIVSPTGAEPDSFNAPLQWCAWHDYTGDGYRVSGDTWGNLAFTNMPYVLDAGASCGENFVNSGSAGTLDGFSIVNGHEYAETITDQFPSGGWTNPSNGQENGDECAWISSGQGAAAGVAMGNGTYAMQSTWSNDTNECDLSHAIVTGSTATDTVTVTNPGNVTSIAGHSTSLQIHASDSLGNALTYSAKGLPIGLGINTTTGLISGTPKKGKYSVTVMATDGTATGSTSFSWNVK
jgi:hypothetical protein